MNKFRVLNTRFRILKGGKIGLSSSIALIGSILIFGSIDAKAVPYSDLVIAEVETYTYNGEDTNIYYNGYDATVNVSNGNILGNILTTTNNTGILNLTGTSTIGGMVGEDSASLKEITVNGTSTFDELVYATTLTYLGNDTVILNGENSSTVEGMVGIVDFANGYGSLQIADGVDLTTGTSGIQFKNANNANLRFNGTSIINGVVGGDSVAKSTFKTIYAGISGNTVTFKNDVYVEESSLIPVTLHVGSGIVNLEGNLYGDLVFDSGEDGTANISDGKSIIVTTAQQAAYTYYDNEGTLNFLGSTTITGDIGKIAGEDSASLKAVNFAALGEDSGTYNENIGHNIYAYDTAIGNSYNKTTANITADNTFGGNLSVRRGSTLNVSNNDVIVENTLQLDSASTTNFKVYTTDISAGQAVENANSGGIVTNLLSVASDAKFSIMYDGSWNGAGKYNLIEATNGFVLGEDYIGTEVNGLVTDNSIIDSVIKKDGNNLTLFADRTGGGSYAAEDLYIKKSAIGTNYSNGASQSLAAYANGTQRESALANIINQMENLDAGSIITNEKKQELITMQKKLSPVANNSGIQSSLGASKLGQTTIGGRISDIRSTGGNVLVLNESSNTTGLSSGESILDSALWIKAMASTSSQDKVGQYDGYDSDTYGVVLGSDKTLKDGTIVGLAFAYSNTNTDQSDFNTGDSSDTNSIQITAYASKEFGNLYLDGMLSYAKHSTDSIRTANSGKLSADIDANQYSAKIESGYRFVFNGSTTLTPFASIEYGFLDQKAYTEKGTSYQNDALRVDGVKVNRGTLGLGAKLATNIEFADMALIPEIKVGVYNSFGDDSADIKAQYLGGGNQFVTPSQEFNDTMFNLGAGVKTKLTESSTLMFNVDYDRSNNGNFEGYSGSVAYRLTF
jgi:outer membrane autotransporter protein